MMADGSWGIEAIRDVAIRAKSRVPALSENRMYQKRGMKMKALMWLCWSASVLFARLKRLAKLTAQN